MKEINRNEINKKYKGYEYLVYATPMGHRCGYVKIPEGHYLYGKSYSEQLNVKFNKISNQPQGKRNVITLLCNSNIKPEDNVSMDLLFDVHGGITYSDKFYRCIKKRGWWIGFDCAHLGDGKDTDIMDDKNKKIFTNYLFLHDEYSKSKEYVEQECKNLIDQIIKYFDENPELVGK